MFKLHDRIITGMGDIATVVYSGHDGFKFVKDNLPGFVFGDRHGAYEYTDSRDFTLAKHDGKQWVRVIETVPLNTLQPGDRFNNGFTYVTSETEHFGLKGTTITKFLPTTPVTRD